VRSGRHPLDALADLAALGVHDPDVQPFTVPWTDVPPDERARSTMQYHWSRWGSWKPSDWALEFAVIRDGEVVGTQGIGGRDFAVLREVRRQVEGLPPPPSGTHTPSTTRTPGHLLTCSRTLLNPAQPGILSPCGR
jgi:hypothetical protein